MSNTNTTASINELGADTSTRTDGEVQVATFHQCEVSAMVQDERDDEGRTVITYTLTVGGEELATGAFAVGEGEDLHRALEDILLTHAPAVVDANA